MPDQIVANMKQISATNVRDVLGHVSSDLYALVERCLVFLGAV
jgi:hypothetical protein